ncbi:MAG TPA: cell division protein CrgA [Acidimicrobiia bacterium]|nr:cell division protein CrgA [Acidimicrobiia bacterium]
MPESKRRKTKRGPSPLAAATAAASKAKSKEPSPTWYVALMSGLMGLGVLAVLARFIFNWNQFWLIGGLVAIAVGFLMTTNFR